MCIRDSQYDQPPNNRIYIRECRRCYDTHCLIAVSYTHLDVYKRQYEGCTYNEYIINLKITEAKKLLECHDCLIGEVAEALGFTDQFYFSKVFKNAVGCTPREYRKQFLI